MQLRALDGTTRLTGLIGHPVQHSRSPRIHQQWIAAHKINARYMAFDVSPTHVGDAIKGARAMGILGLNVTVPHKERVLDFVDDVDALVEEIGAANTLIFSDKGVRATNTDAYGLVASLKHGGRDLAPHVKRVMVLGAGGAARAAIAALSREGAKEILITNRTLANAENLAKSMVAEMQVIPWAHREEMLKDVTLLINTTSLGMQAHEPLPLRLAALPETALVNDVVYAPLETQLLKDAAARGNPVVGGIGMLIYQAQSAFEQWHGVRPQIDDGFIHAIAHGSAA